MQKVFGVTEYLWQNQITGKPTCNGIYATCQLDPWKRYKLDVRYMQGEGGNLTPTQKGFRVDLSAAVFLSPVLRKYLDPTNRSQASSWEMQVTGQQGGSGIYAACEPDSKFGVVLSITHSAGEAATRSRGAKGLRLHAEAVVALIPVIDRFMTAAELGV